jgi:hypothetical protein
MHHVISIGGGISSTWLLVDRVLAKYGKENVTAVICELANESADLWRLVEAVEKKYGIEVKRLHGIVKNPLKLIETTYQFWLRHDPVTALRLAIILAQNNNAYIHWTEKPIDIWDVFFYTGMMGNPFADPCSRMLKRELMAAWMKENFDPANTVLHVGITAGEIDRMLAITANWKRNGYAVEADLCNEPEIDKPTLLKMCEAEFGFIPVAYKWNPNGHNNCNLFCVKAGKGQMARLLWYDRKSYLEHERMELLHQQTFNHTSTIMRDEWTRNGKRGADPLTLRAFRERMQAKWSNMLPGFDPFDGLDDTPGCKFCEAA